MLTAIFWEVFKHCAVFLIFETQILTNVLCRVGFLSQGYFLVSERL